MAFKKVRALLDSYAQVKVVSLDFIDELLEMNDENLTLLQKAYDKSDLKDVWLVISATGNPKLDRTIFSDCEDNKLWINSADQFESCNFILPAKSEKSGIMVSVSTFGKSPTFAAWLRDYFDELLDEDLILLFNLLTEARQRLKDNNVPTESANLKQFVNENVVDLIKTKQYELAEATMEDYISTII